MSQPTDVPSIRAVADRVLGIVAASLQPAFIAALARHTSKDLKPEVTEEEVAAVTRELPDAVAGHPVEELDVVVGHLLAQHRSQASAAKMYQDTLVGFGPRATKAGTGRQPASRPPAAPSWSAVPVGGTSSGLDEPCGQPPSESYEPCAIAGTPLDFAEVGLPTGLVSAKFVKAAGVLAVLYQLGDRAGFFSAVDRAVQQLDSDTLCIDEVALLNRLHCYGELDNRVKAPERASLGAKVLGLRDPNLPPTVQPDPIIPGLLDNLLDAINAHGDPGVFRDKPTPTDIVRLRQAVQAVHVRLSSSVTGFTTLRVQDLQVQFGRALEILRALAPFVQPLCRPGLPGGDDVAQRATRTQKEWISVSALNGAKLPDGTDLLDAAVTARAWQIVFEWLIEQVDRPTTPPPEVGEAAALLRPARTARDKSGCCGASRA